MHPERKPLESFDGIRRVREGARATAVGMNPRASLISDANGRSIGRASAPKDRSEQMGLLIA